MHELEIVKSLWSKFSGGDYQAAKPLFCADVKVIWPASREYFDSVDEFIAVNEAFGRDWTFAVQHVENIGLGKVISVVFVTSPSWPKSFHATSIFTFRAKKIAHMETYWAAEDCQPEWRKALSKVY